MNGLQSTLQNLELLITGDSYAKICGLLYSFSQEYGEETEKGTLINHQTTHKLIASLTGLTRETVTAQLDKITKNGLIIREGKQITVTDIDGIRDAAGITK
jgi:CRP-like cAMP-binding protein